MKTADNIAGCAWLASFETLDTERLELRRLTLDDLDEFHAAMHEPRVSKWIGSFAQPFTRDAAKRWLDERIDTHRSGEGAYMALRRHGDPAIIGFLGVRCMRYDCPELSFALAYPHWGNRYIEEASHAVSGWLRDAGVKKISATAALDNVRSLRVMKLLGFQQCGEVDFNRPDGTLRRSHYCECVL